MYSPLISKLPFKSWTFHPSEKYIDHSVIFHFVYQKYAIDSTKYAEEHMLKNEVVNGVFNPEFMSLQNYKHQSKRLEYMLMSLYLLHERYNKDMFGDYNPQKNVLNMLSQNMAFKNCANDKVAVKVRRVQHIKYARGTIYDGPLTVGDFGWFLHEKEGTHYLRIKAVE